MRLSALVHCRTFSFDFNPEFLARPSDFTSDDINWAREHILPATAYCDELEGKRYVLFSNSRYCVFGIVSLLDNALSMFGFSEESVKRYSFDENKRKIKCFIGFVFHVSDKSIGYIPMVNDGDYNKLLESYVANDQVFFSNSQPCIQVDYTLERETGQFLIKEKPNEYCISSNKNDEDMFTNLMSNVSSINIVNFCSNVYNLKMLEDGKFDFFTANQNTIQRYNIKRAESDQKNREVIEQEKSEDIKTKEEGKKKRRPKGCICSKCSNTSCSNHPNNSSLERGGIR